MTARISEKVTGITGQSYDVLDPHSIDVPELDGISKLALQIVTQRGVTPEEYRDFFNPTIRNTMPNPSFLKDMDEAAELVAQAITDNLGIGMVGDYDVDGATSVAIVSNFLRDVGHENRDFYIPQRLSEGYGVNDFAVRRLHENGCRVLIVLDSGTRATGPISLAVSLGMDVIVIDHHEPGSDWEKPPAFVINPKRDGNTADMTSLCTAGLSILFCVRISSVLSKQGWTGLPNIMDYMGLAALGTVADVMPLRGLNRAYVKSGLSRMYLLPGLCGLTLAALKVNGAFCNNRPEVQSSDLGFRLGPIINAAGRIDDCNLGSSLLTNMDFEDAFKLGVEMVEINEKRKEMQKNILEEALAQAGDIYRGGNTLVVYGKDWHPGIIGVVAGRLKEKYNIPVVVIGGRKGSGRSAHDFDLGGAIIDAYRSGMLVKGGGHQAAAGLEIEAENIDAFRAFLEERAQGLVRTSENIDGVLPMKNVTTALVRELSCLEPFGTDMKAPVWLLKNVVVTSIRRIKEIHAKIFFEGEGNRQSAMIFNIEDSALREIENRTGEDVSLVVSIEESAPEYKRYQELDIKIIDIVFS